MSATSDVDDLYDAPHNEFVARRDALAKARKAAGDKDGAAAVKALRRPSVSAWAVNRVARSRIGGLESLLRAGDAVRAAQIDALSGRSGGLPAAMATLRAELDAHQRVAAELLTSDGHAATEATLRRVRTTLEAVALYGSALPGPPPGRMCDDVDPPGFDVLLAMAAELPLRDVAPPAASVVPAPTGPAPLPSPPSEDARRAAARREAIERAAAARDAARARRDEAARAVSVAAEEVEHLEARLAEARASLTRGREALESAEAAHADAQLRWVEASSDSTY